MYTKTNSSKHKPQKRYNSRQRHQKDTKIDTNTDKARNNELPQTLSHKD